MRRRRLALLAVVLAAAVALDARLILFAPTDAPTAADAMVVLAGAESERLPRALALLDQGYARTLVVSYVPGDTSSHRTAQLCAAPPRGVVCEQPHPASTRGEARMVDQLARRFDWGRLLVVTSRMHARRARTMLGRCVKARVRVVAAPNPASVQRWVRLLVHETGGLAQTLVQRGC